jgi:Flp pilus assembly protein TadG
MPRPLDRLQRCAKGSAAVEFALVGPLFILLIIGTVVYGGWMWMAQGVQHLAAEGARAAIAGIDADERTSLAQSAVSGSVDGSTILDPEAIQVAVVNDPGTIRVTITYDASDHPLMALANLVPSPPSTIQREAVVRTGGY